MSDEQPKIAGVIGSPISHSKSPAIHNFWLRRHGTAGLYVAIEVKPSDLRPFLKHASRAGFRGFNVTIPHKIEALEICDTVTETARACGAINTIVFDADGGIHGDSTDGYGFLENLESAWPGSFARDLRVSVIGAGGAARAVAVALAQSGAKEIRISNRTPAKASDLATAAPEVATVHAWPPGPSFFNGADLIVNATSLGMSGAPPFDLDLSGLTSGVVATDLIYAPLDTPFLQAARQAGAHTIDGLGMLLHQARPGFKAWFGHDAHVDQELRDFVLNSEGWFQ